MLVVSTFEDSIRSQYARRHKVWGAATAKMLPDFELKTVKTRMSAIGHRPHRDFLETLQVLRRLAQRGDWMWSVDLSDAYHHVGIHEDDQQYFTFALQTEDGTEYFSCSALNFGWCMAIHARRVAPS